MDTWQDEMNMTGHTPYYGVPYLTSDPDSKYTSNSSPDDISVAVETSSGNFEHSSRLSAKPQVNWMLAPNPNKVNWLEASEARPNSAGKMTM